MVCRVISTFLTLGRCALLLALATSADQALAQQDRQTERNPISAVLGAVGLLPPDTSDMPDFVTRTRPPAGSLHYVPVGGPRPEPAAKALTPDEINAQEAALSNLRSRDDLRAGRKPPVVMARSAAGRPVVKKKKTQFSCRITCTIVTKIGHNDSMR